MYDSFFVSVVGLTSFQRTILFYTVCTSVRIIIGLLFWIFASEVVLSYFAAIWGALWLLLSLINKRWVDKPTTPPWWKGTLRIVYRFLFSVALLSLGIGGSIDQTHLSNRIIAIQVWFDLVVSIVNYSI